MSSLPPEIEASVTAIMAGAAAELLPLLQQLTPPSVGDTSKAASFGALFWAEWRRHAELHEGFIAVLAPLQNLLHSLDPVAWITAPNHPLWELLTVVRAAGAGYEPELGRAGDRILGEWSKLLEPMHSDNLADVLQGAREHWQQEQQKLQRLEQRLIDSQRGQLRSWRAQQLAARELNRAMGGLSFSADMADFLQRDWYGELQWGLLQWGETDPRWRERVTLTGRLAESLQDAGTDAEARQRLYAVIPEVEAELRAALLARAHDAQMVERQLARVEVEHLALLKGRPVATAPFTLLASDNPWLSDSMSISRDLLQQVTELPLGSEYRVRDGERDLRARLILKIDDTHQLLLVNRVGVKTLQKSFEEFAYWLATGVAAPMPAADDSPRVARRLLRQLLALSERQARTREAMREREQAEQQRRLIAREKALAEAQTLAAAEAALAQEAELQARELELQRRREQADDAYRGDDAQRRRQARQIAAGMAIGSWVEFHDELGGAQRLRLAVKLSSSGKLIFVDREGVRRIDCERDLFAARLLDGSARVLDQGPQFEDTLAKVVDSLRRDRAARE